MGNAAGTAFALAYDTMGSLEYMDINYEYTDVSGGRYCCTTAISNFWPRNGERGHLNNTMRKFLWWWGNTVLLPFFVEIFLNKTAKSSSKREDKTRRWNIHKKIPSVFQKDCKIGK